MGQMTGLAGEVLDRMLAADGSVKSNCVVVESSRPSPAFIQWTYAGPADQMVIEAQNQSQAGAAPAGWGLHDDYPGTIMRQIIGFSGMRRDEVAARIEEAIAWAGWGAGDSLTFDVVE